MSSYITVFHHAVFCVVDITNNRILDRFVVGLNPKIHEKILLSQVDTFEKACIAFERVGIVFMDMGSSSSNPSWL